jgi:hypothetical protein
MFSLANCSIQLLFDGRSDTEEVTGSEAGSGDASEGPLLPPFIDRHSPMMPGESDTLPAPQAVIVAPATVNTLNKWALGICDTLALGILVEGIGKKLPIVALPFTNYAQAAHPAFQQSIDKLRTWGAQVFVWTRRLPTTRTRHRRTVHRSLPVGPGALCPEDRANLRCSVELTSAGQAVQMNPSVWRPSER